MGMHTNANKDIGVRACADTAFCDVEQTMTYNAKDFELPKGAFPFRNEEFAVSCDKAKSVREYLDTFYHLKR
jgi:hypothetical protein